MQPLEAPSIQLESLSLTFAVAANEIIEARRAFAAVPDLGGSL
jgi:hypothetical protein